MPTWLIAALVVFVVIIVAAKIFRGGGKSKASRSGINETRHFENVSEGPSHLVERDMDGFDHRPDQSARGIFERLDPQGRERILASIRKSRKIEAIKEFRELTGLGLKESKDAVEEIEQLGLHK